MVPQSRQNRNYIISDLLAFQQPIAVQIANVDNAVSEPLIGAAEFTVHPKRSLAHIDQNLAREFSEQPKHSETIFRHSQRHGSLVMALQFQVNKAPIVVVGLAKEVYTGVLHLGQLDIQPLLNRGAGQLAQRDFGRPPQQQLQRYVVILHESLSRRRRLNEINCAVDY